MGAAAGALSFMNTALSFANNMKTATRSGNSASDQAAQLKAEREAKAEEQRKLEADERKRDREKITEARDNERRRMATDSAEKTTLLNGGAGLLEEPKVKTTGLKQKFGE